MTNNNFLVKHSLLILALTFTITFSTIRLTNLNNIPVYADTFSWLYRINYYPWIVSENLQNGPVNGKNLKYAGTISYHPGVTLMTFSGISTKIGKKILRNTDPDYEDCAYEDYTCKYLNTELFIAKLPLIIINAILLGLTIYILSKIFGVSKLYFFIIVVFWESEFIRASKDLHLDFIFSSFLLASISLLLYGVINNKNRYIFISGIAMGFVILTRFVGIIFLPIIFLALYFLNKKTLIKRFAIFTFSCSLTFILIYPPMWVSPIDTIKYIINSSIEISDNMNEIYPFHVRYSNGILWYFNALKTTFSYVLLTLLPTGIIASLFFSKNRKIIYTMLFIFISYILFINLADKKYIRYLIPALLGLTAISSIGLNYLLNYFIEKLKR